MACRLLNFSPWDEDACRDALSRYVVRHLGDLGTVCGMPVTGSHPRLIHDSQHAPSLAGPNNLNLMMFRPPSTGA